LCNRRKLRFALPCADCRADTWDEYYMVHNEVWAESGMTPLGGKLCIGCMETRLGRQLAAADFTPVPLNDLFSAGFHLRSPRLIDRLTDGAWTP
jgi:hypothetical protein